MTERSLQSKNGIVGVCQHGDLFWDKVTDQQVNDILDIIDAVAPNKIAQRQKAGRPAPKYILWTKRVERMCTLMTKRYKDSELGRVPDWYGLGASLENQELVDERLPYLAAVPGFRIAVLEPILGEIDLSEYIEELDWVIVGSETGTTQGQQIKTGSEICVMLRTLLASPSSSSSSARVTRTRSANSMAGLGTSSLKATSRRLKASSTSL
jgi:protein gp37